MGRLIIGIGVLILGFMSVTWLVGLFGIYGIPAAILAAVVVLWVMLR